MPEQPLVSIIVPIYNAQDHIARCVESIRRQTYKNIEILLLNDGSQDVSLQVCEMYARVDDRIVLIDKANTIPFSPTPPKCWWLVPRRAGQTW